MGISQLLGDIDVTDAQRSEYLDLINKNSETLLNIIDDIIDISKIEAGQMKVYRRSFLLNDLLGQVKALFINNPVYVSKPNLELRFTQSLSDNLCIYSDPDRLRQILINLVNNAIKFTSKGYIEVGYKLRGSMLEFYVKDSGIGISEDKQELIYNRFMQADTSLTRKYGGAGLGLAISKGLLDLLGGQIWVYSEPDNGSTFHFEIPFIPAFDDTVGSNGARIIPAKVDFTDRTFLIVEDDKVSLKFLDAVLKKTGATVLHTDNGMDAIDICRSFQDIDLVLMDIQLPGMNGLETTKQIHSLRRDLPIIAQTANAMTEDRDRCIEVGCVDYISKPINTALLFSKIQQYLNVP